MSYVARSGERIGSSVRTDHHGTLGFRFVNGVVVGGSFSSSVSYYWRCACRVNWYARSFGQGGYIGFRSVNGVFRSGTYGDSGLRCRSGGIRWNSSKRTYVHNGVGFRCVNGVTRGGCYGGGWEYHANRVRNASRHNRVLDYVYSLRGFRCEWCTEGRSI